MVSGSQIEPDSVVKPVWTGAFFAARRTVLHNGRFDDLALAGAVTRRVALCK